MAVDTAIKNCKIVTPQGTFSAGIGIHSQKIVAIARDEDLPPANKVVDARGNYVIPGLVDAHTHLFARREAPPAAILSAETQACAYGGCTTCLDLVRAADIKKAAEDYLAVFRENGYIDMGFTTAIHDVGLIKQIRDIAEFGIVGFKVLMPYRGAEAMPGTPDIDDGIIYLLFEQVGRLAKEGYKVHVRIHCENVEIFFKLKERFLEQGVEPSSYHETRPSFLEAEAMHRAIYLANLVGCPLYIVHLSIKEGVDIVAKARADGVNVIAETCPQYLVLNVDNTDKVLSKVNPPIRTKEDNETLWEGIRDGVISVVASDHAPVPKQYKKDLWTARMGISVVESWLPAMLSEGVNKKRISLEKLVEVCCYNPARIYGLTPEKGVIAVGSDADLVIVDLNKEAVVAEKPAYSGTDFTPFADMKFKGWPILTMVRGNVVMEEGRIVGKPGGGKFMPSKAK
ncbi:MAG: dihydroorotase family protein [Candidatus Binatia bacterium]